MSEFLIFGRPIKNLLYILVGMVIGGMAGFGLSLNEISRVDIIILITGTIFFIIEFVLYIAYLTKEILKVCKKKGKKAKNKQ